MWQIVLYLVVAAACAGLYIIMHKDIYFRDAKAEKATGQIGEIVRSGEKLQYQVIFSDTAGIWHSAMTPTYAADTGHYRQGDTVPIRYVQMKIGKSTVFSVRIENPGLVRRDNYKACLVLSGILLVFALARCVAMILM